MSLVARKRAAVAVAGASVAWVRGQELAEAVDGLPWGRVDGVVARAVRVGDADVQPGRAVSGS